MDSTFKGQASKRKHIYFDPEQEDSETIQELKRSKSTSGSQASDLVDDKVDDPKAEVISGLYLKCGFGFVEDLRLVLSVVSEECGPWRKEMVIDLLQRVRNVTLSPKYVEVVELCIREELSVLSQATSTYVLPIQSSQMILEKLLTNGDVYGGCLSPPTSTCYQCGFKLSKNNKPIYVTLFTATGPLPMKKVELRCRHCSLNYGVSKFGNKNNGYQFYSSPRYVVEASDVCYIDRTVMAFFSALSHHAWVSFAAFAEAYNEAIDSQDNHFVPELKRKMIQEAFWNDELHQEIVDHQMNFIFHKPDCRERCMMDIDKQRALVPYEHECHSLCKERGCGELFVTDGIWKLGYPICLFKVPVTVEGMMINLPDCCPFEPEHGKLFCKKHASELKDAGIPENLLGYARKIQKEVVATAMDCCNEDLTDEQHKALEDISKRLNYQRYDSIATVDMQGSRELVTKYPGLLDENQEITLCRKDTGVSKRLRQWSRSYQFIISGGGHIEMFSPLYTSESPSQVFLFLVNYLAKKLEHVPVEKWKDVFIAYDNMCNLDRMKARFAITFTI